MSMSFSTLWLEFLVVILRMEQPELLQLLLPSWCTQAEAQRCTGSHKHFLDSCMGGMSLSLLSFSYIYQDAKKITQTTLFPLLFQLHKMVSASLAFSDFFRSLFEAKGRQMGCKWTNAEPGLG